MTDEQLIDELKKIIKLHETPVRKGRSVPSRHGYLKIDWAQTARQMREIAENIVKSREEKQV
jgi:hypothetical protein